MFLHSISGTDNAGRGYARGKLLSCPDRSNTSGMALDKGEQHLANARTIYGMSGFLIPGLITSGKGALLLKQ